METLLGNRRWLIASLVMSLAVTLTVSRPALSQTCADSVTDYASFTACVGNLADGRPYGFKVPTDWNGRLVIYCHGYHAPGTPTPGTDWAMNAFAEPVSRWLLENGHAVAASFGGNGWAVHEAMRNQIETLDTFAAMFGAPTQTIVYGGSLGGITTAGLIQQHPERFDGALPMAGPLAGAVGTWNTALDFAFVVKGLLDYSSALEVVNITNAGTPTSGNWGLARQLLATAQGSAAGKARIALACAVFDVPGWFDWQTPEPAADDYTTREFNQYLWAREVLAGYVFGYGRRDVEVRAGGNPSWNTGVDYDVQLQNSVNYAEVVALYAAAGLDLQADLAVLSAAPRISADAAAVDYMSQNIVFRNLLGRVPTLTLHSTGDGLVTVQHESTYRSQDPLLRQAFLHRGGHGPYTSAEMIAAFQALFQRIDSGTWGEITSPEALNAAALALGPLYNVVVLSDGGTVPTPPAFIAYEPAPFLRPYVITVSVENGNPRVAARALSAWPLPYRSGSLQVSFAPGAGAGGGVIIAIYDVSGRQIRMLARAARGGGESLQWDGRDASGAKVGSGVYFLRATNAERSAQLKFVLLR